MSARTILTTATGTNIDLRDPAAADIDFAWVAEHLAKEKRYNGATAGREYSVAEHSVRCADAALRFTRDRTLAAYLLVHDGHEATLKDDTTPKKNALAEAASDFGILREQILEAFARLTDRHDVAIHQAAGLPWPPSPGLQREIKRFDLILFVTEWRDLMNGAQHPAWEPYRAIEPLAETIEPMPWKPACTLFLQRCRELLPALRLSSLQQSIERSGSA